LRCAWADPDDERKPSNSARTALKLLPQSNHSARHTRISKEIAELPTNQITGWASKDGLCNLMLLGKGSTHYEPIGMKRADCRPVK